MVHVLLCALLFSVFGVMYGGNSSQTDKRTQGNLLKSLIYDNTKATVTLDPSALKQLIRLSSAASDSASSKQHVSFSVNLDYKPLTLGAGQTVKYDAVLINDGNGYDDRTGVFTCPVAGTYMFVVDSLSYPGIWLLLKVNKKTVGFIHVSSAHKGNPGIQISRTVIVKLKSGDHVKVENLRNNAYVHDDLYSGFTGVLLY
ncbi:EMILIN-2-like isoform X1 [Crassostrea angulata]|uniref:EMILIN-2-like isoform X1 n=1 Tax=Magallana angulata TaxID=2784310 RepID=UPI0022B0CCF9|nr:EMILIN-2-like isoform X1 [Crassostrea angulata]